MTTTEIASIIPGRSVHSYDLLDEITEKYGMSRSDAHDAIHALLAQIVDIDGEAAVILSQRPIRPELLEDNPSDLDIYYWLTISEETAQTIRDAIAATRDSADTSSIDVTSAQVWADALDAEMERTGHSAGELVSFGYARGHLCGVQLDPQHPDADDDRAVIASAGGWVVGYDAQSGYWTAR